MEFIIDYGLFLAKTVTVLILLALTLAVISGLLEQEKEESGELHIVNLNERLDGYREILEQNILSEEELKQQEKHKKQQEKARKKAANKDETLAKPRLFVLDFDGDIRASEVESLRIEISALLTMAKPEDEILVRLESSGGLVHSYGLAASQLRRVREREIPLVVAVDKVAASGGYMMACVANRIIAAPFAVIGSIGVIAQLPNFHRLLEKNAIDFEQHTAGQFKRTLTMFGENTDEARDKFLQELEDTHQLFKQFVGENRPQLNLEQVATGEHWYGSQAQQLGLVDELQSSDDYLLNARSDKAIYLVSYSAKRSLLERLGLNFQTSVDRLLGNWQRRSWESRLFK